jgi:hypothetical protein
MTDLNIIMQSSVKQFVSHSGKFLRQSNTVFVFLGKYNHQRIFITNRKYFIIMCVQQGYCRWLIQVSTIKVRWFSSMASNVFIVGMGDNNSPNYAKLIP